MAEYEVGIGLELGFDYRVIESLCSDLQSSLAFSLPAG